MEPLAAGDPRQVGQYRLHGRLGAGGMGRVFLGSSPLGRAVAVKIIHPELARDPAFVRQFRVEVQAAGAVGGAYTAPIVAAGPDDDPPWLATVFVAGPSLADAVAEAGPFPEAAVWRLAGGLVEALQAVHACRLVHRDLTPRNVLLAVDGPRVIDFGICRALEGTGVTMRGGTAMYMSPEQAVGSTVRPASDVFCLGCVIAFAATGATPFGHGEPLAVMYQVVNGEPDLGGIAGPLRDLVAGCLAKGPADRPSLERLVDVIMAGSASYPGTSPISFWPDPVAGLVRSRQDSLRTEVLPGADVRPPSVMQQPPHEPPTRVVARESPPKTVRQLGTNYSVRRKRRLPPTDKPPHSGKVTLLRAPGVDVPAVGAALGRWYESEGMVAQVLPHDGAIIVQTQSSGRFRRAAGGAVALTVILGKQGAYLAVEIGPAHWLSRGAIGGAALVSAHPFLAVPAARGAITQALLPGRTMKFIESHVAKLPGVAG